MDNGDDLTGRPRDMWFIDLPLGLSRADAALFASPFNHVEAAPDEDGKLIHELRAASGSSSDTYRVVAARRPRPEMRSRIERLSRYIVTAETAKYRLFVWLAYPVLPDKNYRHRPRRRSDVRPFAFRFHEAWSLRLGLGPSGPAPLHPTHPPSRRSPSPKA